MSLIGFGWLSSFSAAQSLPRYIINTVAGDGDSGYAGDAGPATSAQLNFPYSSTVDSSGNIYIADQLNSRIRKVAPDGTISTIAGTGAAGFSGDNGKATSATLYDPSSAAVDAAGNIYIADTDNSVIRKISTNGNISTVAGNYNLGAGYSGDGGSATTNAVINHPSGVALDSAGNIYIVDTGNCVVRKVTTNGIITTVVGSSACGYAGDGNVATKADLLNPVSLAIDAAGNLYIADQGNHRIRKVTASTNTISTLAGAGTSGFSGDGGAASKAQLSSPKGVAVDAAGNVFIADTINSRIRVVAPNGNISTIAGTGVAGFSGDGGTATAARLKFPSGVAVDKAGNVYVTDNQNNRVRVLAPQQIGAPAISAAISAGAFGAFAAAAPGSWIEIYGSNLAANSRGWTGADFNGTNAPTSLDGTSVTIAGQPAFVAYISPGQVNVQVPSLVPPGLQPIIVTTTAGGSSVPSNIAMYLTVPGLFAPSSFNVSGRQYLGALFSDGATFAMPAGAVGGIFSRPAKPGEIITLYGVGFGPVSPDTPTGLVVPQLNNLVNPIQIMFGQVPAALTYYGLAPGAVGLYQFNVVVPNIAPSDAVPVTFTLGGIGGVQTLYTSVGQ